MAAQTSPLAGFYPPDVHVLRDLRLWIERDASGSRTGLELVPQMHNVRGHAQLGVLATLVDGAGGECALRAALPDWVATSDLVLHVARPLRSGTLLAVPEVLRRTRTTVVIEVTLREGGSGGEAAGLATMTFSVLPARGEVQRMGAGRDEPRTEFASADSRLDAPFLERIGARVVDAAEGRIELPLSPYVGNSLGALQGGLVAALADLAAERLAGAASGAPCATTDLALNYLALGRVGPIRTRGRLLRREPAGAVVRIELRDAGAQDRLVAVASATAQAFG
jgi:uncharacterized protein (TIGR00369 family)